MGVKVCSRVGCSEIMCDRLSDEYGYICHSCFDELMSTGLHTDIKEFLATPVAKKEDLDLLRKMAAMRYEKIFPFDK